MSTRLGGVDLDLACGVVDASCGPARALRDVWTSRGQPVGRVVPTLPTRAGLSPTTPQAPPSFAKREEVHFWVAEETITNPPK